MNQTELSLVQNQKENVTEMNMQKGFIFISSQTELSLINKRKENFHHNHFHINLK